MNQLQLPPSLLVNNQASINNSNSLSTNCSMNHNQLGIIPGFRKSLASLHKPVPTKQSKTTRIIFNNNDVLNKQNKENEKPRSSSQSQSNKDRGLSSHTTNIPNIQINNNNNLLQQSVVLTNQPGLSKNIIHKSSASFINLCISNETTAKKQDVQTIKNKALGNMLGIFSNAPTEKQNEENNNNNNTNTTVNPNELSHSSTSISLNLQVPLCLPSQAAPLRPRLQNITSQILNSDVNMVSNQNYNFLNNKNNNDDTQKNYISIVENQSQNIPESAKEQKDKIQMKETEDLNGQLNQQDSDIIKHNLIIQKEPRRQMMLTDNISPLFSPREETADDQKYQQILRQRDFLLEIHYKDQLNKNLIVSDIVCSDALIKHNLKPYMRAKMVNWMFEVFDKVSRYTTYSTIFRSVSIMDLYLKTVTNPVFDDDIHLIGIAAMFISTKIEDIEQIPLKKFIQQVAHDKFNELDIKNMECDILMTIQFLTDFPTVYLFYRRFMMQSLEKFRGEDFYDVLVDIEKVSLHWLQMTLYSHEIYAFEGRVVAFSVLKYSISSYYQNLQIQKIGNAEELQHMIDDNMDQIMYLTEEFDIDIEKFKQCNESICNHILFFDSVYKDLNNGQNIQFQF